MNDFIDLPHLPECLLNLPLETIHEIHSHTYHAIKADRQWREGSVTYGPFGVSFIGTGVWAGIPAELPSELVGKQVYVSTTAPQPTIPEGWKLAPVEPTDDMALAACRVGLRNPAINGVDQYKAMLAAAPKFGEEEE